MIWFCKRTKRQERQTKIEFSKLKNQVQEIGRRSSIISLQAARSLDEEQKIAIAYNPEEEDDTDDSELEGNGCLVCCDNVANMINYPCGHVCYCHNCAQAVIEKDDLCPHCRQKISDCKQIYHAGFRV